MARPLKAPAPAAPAAAGDVVIRDVADADMPAVQAIYAHHVLNGLASFELEPPDVREMIRRRDTIRAGGYPYRVAVVDGRVLGYAYASQFRPRPAYMHTVEDSVYVADGAHRRGIGRRLLADLIDKCTALGYRQMIAVIGDSANAPSIGVHEALGFRHAGVMKSCGFKFGRWVDTVVMQRPLGEGDGTLPKPRP
jgi:phosphinothricin acetyltransferase